MIINKLADRMNECGVSQGELGRHLGLKKQTMSEIFKGNRTLKADEFIEICKYLEVEPGSFYEAD